MLTPRSTHHRLTMKQFLIAWSLISPGCLILIASFLQTGQITWYPASDRMLSLVIYGTYWGLVSGLQSLLLWRVQGPSFALKWGLTTATTGFALMLAHDLFVLDVLDVNIGWQGGTVLLKGEAFKASG